MKRWLLGLLWVAFCACLFLPQSGRAGIEQVPQTIGPPSNVQVNSLGVGVAADGTAGDAKAGAFISSSANPATTGAVRLGSADAINARDFSNLVDLHLFRPSNSALNEVWLGDTQTQAVVTKASGTGIPLFTFNGEAVTDIAMAKRATDQWQLLRGDLSGNGIELDTVAAGSSPTAKPAGSDVNITLQLSGKGTGGVSLPGGATLQSTGGTAPTLSAGCNGAGSAVAVGSTNNRGQFTTQTAAATTCTLSFSASSAWNQAPFCVFTDANASITPLAFSAGAIGTSTAVIDFASGTNLKVNYICM